jgi:hypothetical protein
MIKSANRLRKIELPIQAFEETKFQAFNDNVKNNYYFISIDYQGDYQSEYILDNLIKKHLDNKCKGKFHCQRWNEKVYIWLEDSTDEVMLLLQSKIYI